MAVDVASRRWALPSLGWITGYTELLRTMLRREVRARYKRSALGLVWSIVYPLAMMGVYTLIFSVLWKTTSDIPHYPLFVLSGLAVWGFFQSALQLGTGAPLASAVAPPAARRRAPCAAGPVRSPGSSRPSPASW